MAKTQAELDEEERQRKLQETLTNAKGWWDSLPSFGTLFTLLFVAVGAYFIAKIPGVQEWIGKTFGEDWKKSLQGLIGNADEMIGNAASALGLGGYVNDYAASMPVDQVQTKMREKGLPDAAIEALAGTPEIWKDTVSVIKAGGGVVTDPISDKNIFAFLTQRPQVVQKLLASVPMGGPMDDKQKAFAAQLTAAIKPILADDRLDQLLTTYRATTLPLLLQFSPVPIDATKLGTALDKIALGADGKATPAFRELLTSLVTMTGDATADQKAQMDALQKFLSSPGIDGAALKLFAQSVDVSKLPAGQMKSLITAAQQSDAATLDAQRQLLTTLPLSAVQKFGALAADPQGPVKMLDALMNDGALRGEIIGNNALEPIGKILQGKLAASTNPEERGMLSFLTSHPKGQPTNFTNLKTMFKLVDDLANNDRNINYAAGPSQGKIGPRAQAVMHAMMGYVLAKNPAEQKAALANVTPQQLSQFFANPGNSRAFGEFFANISTTYLPPQQRAAIAALRSQWGEVVLDEKNHLDTAKSHGLAEVFADPTAVAFLLEQMRKPKSNAPLPTEAEMRNNLAWGTWQGTWLGSIVGVPQTGTIPENANAMIAMMQSVGAIAPSATPKTDAASPRRGT